MFGTAYKLWGGPQLRRVFAEKFRAVARNYVGSAFRVARTRPAEVPGRLCHGCK